MSKDNGKSQEKPTITIEVGLAKNLSDYIQQVPSGTFPAGLAIQLIGQLQLAMAQAGYLLNGPGQPVTKGKQPDLAVVEPEVEAPKGQ